MPEPWRDPKECDEEYTLDDWILDNCYGDDQ